MMAVIMRALESIGRPFFFVADVRGGMTAESLATPARRAEAERRRSRLRRSHAGAPWQGWILRLRTG